MSSAISDPAQAVTARIKDELGDRTQAWLGMRVAEIEERPEGPYSQPTAGDWLRRPEIQPPSRIFAIERALDLPPGTLSRPLGYLPVDARPVLTVEDAINADPKLNRAARKLLVSAYRSQTGS